MANIGIYSGSFNPIHLGHTSLAEYILKNTDLDEIWLLVSPNNPLKNRADLMDEKLRFEMAEIAVENMENIKASDFEFHLPKPSYTVNTLKALSCQFPEHHFSLIIGSDNMALFDKWKDYDYILSHYPIIVYPRKGDDLESLIKKYPQMQILQNAPMFDVSSTEIRDKIAKNEDVSNLIDAKVAQIYMKFGK